MKIYLASSWRNQQQPEVLAALRDAGHEVYDFRNPAPGQHGFGWSEIDPKWRQWSARQYCGALRHPVADRGFSFDWNAMLWAEAGVLLLPSGRSAHLEAGYFVGAKKPLYILIHESEDSTEPELMYKMAKSVCLSTSELVAMLALLEEERHPPRCPDCDSVLPYCVCDDF